MAADRFIYFKKERRPTRDELESVLKNFLGSQVAGEVEWNEQQSRFYVTLPGKTSFPFQDLTDALRHPFADEKRERWIEVWMDPEDPTIDVMTRGMDEYTNVIANGIVKMLARYWEGEMEDE
jgi:hypothetical protein